jgi:hypothetical protein
MSAWLPEAARRLTNSPLLQRVVASKLASRAGSLDSGERRKLALQIYYERQGSRCSEFYAARLRDLVEHFACSFVACTLSRKRMPCFGPSLFHLGMLIALITRTLFRADSSLTHASRGILEAFRDRQATANWRNIRNFTTLLAARDLSGAGELSPHKTQRVRIILVHRSTHQA